MSRFTWGAIIAWCLAGFCIGASNMTAFAIFMSVAIILWALRDLQLTD